jgi:hypothetical protein
MKFTKSDAAKIAGILDTQSRWMGNKFRFRLENQEANRSLSLENYPDNPHGARKGTLVSVYTPTSHLQLHFCSGYVVSEVLGEVTFFSEHDGRLSGLIIEKEAACNLYANVDASLLSGDFTKLGPEVMLSGVALSLTEHLLPSTEREGWQDDAACA